MQTTQEQNNRGLVFPVFIKERKRGIKGTKEEGSIYNEEKLYKVLGLDCSILTLANFAQKPLVLCRKWKLSNILNIHCLSFYIKNLISIFYIDPLTMYFLPVLSSFLYYQKSSLCYIAVVDVLVALVNLTLNSDSPLFSS